MRKYSKKQEIKDNFDCLKKDIKHFEKNYKKIKNGGDVVFFIGGCTWHFEELKKLLKD